MKKLLLIAIACTIIASCSKDDVNGPERLSEVEVEYILDPGEAHATVSILRFQDTYVSELIDTVTRYRDLVPIDGELSMSMSVWENQNPSVKIVVGKSKDTIFVKDRITNGAGYSTYYYKQRLPINYFTK